jgi:hypothetical protein
LITAVKGGRREIVEALLGRHVEIDAVGSVLNLFEFILSIWSLIDL